MWFVYWLIIVSVVLAPSVVVKMYDYTQRFKQLIPRMPKSKCDEHLKLIAPLMSNFMGKQFPPQLTGTALKCLDRFSPKDFVISNVPFFKFGIDKNPIYNVRMFQNKLILSVAMHLVICDENGDGIASEQFATHVDQFNENIVNQWSVVGDFLAFLTDSQITFSRDIHQRGVTFQHDIFHRVTDVVKLWDRIVAVAELSLIVWDARNPELGYEVVDLLPSCTVERIQQIYIFGDLLVLFGYTPLSKIVMFFVSRHYDIIDVVKLSPNVQMVISVVCGNRLFQLELHVTPIHREIYGTFYASDGKFIERWKITNRELTSEPSLEFVNLIFYRGSILLFHGRNSKVFLLTPEKQFEVVKGVSVPHHDMVYCHRNGILLIDTPANSYFAVS